MTLNDLCASIYIKTNLKKISPQTFLQRQTPRYTTFNRFHNFSPTRVPRQRFLIENKQEFHHFLCSARSLQTFPPSFSHFLPNAMQNQDCSEKSISKFPHPPWDPWKGNNAEGSFSLHLPFRYFHNFFIIVAARERQKKNLKHHDDERRLKRKILLTCFAIDNIVRVVVVRRIVVIIVLRNMTVVVVVIVVFLHHVHIAQQTWDRNVADGFLEE